MSVQRHDKGASQWGAPFAFWLLLAFATPLLACPLDKADEVVKVAKVSDGDTVRLADGRKVRFIGINTPEIGHDGAPSQPYAQAARKRLKALIGSGRLQLRYDVERKDRYGRLLAHPYLANGRSVSRILLDEGLAAVVVVSPNLWQNECYFRHEREARARHRGIWSDRHWPVKDVQRLRRGDEGFALLQGRVEGVAESRRSLWLELDGNAALQIPRNELHYFSGVDELRAWIGKRIEVRGWLTYHGGKWRMAVHHPAALQPLANK